MIGRFAPQDVNVLIVGPPEPGTRAHEGDVTRRIKIE